MTGQAQRWIDRYMPRITLVVVVGTCLCFIGLGYIQSQVWHQAAQGRLARQLQCHFRPMTFKEQQYFRRIHVITDTELKRLLQVLPPANCASQTP